MPFTASVTRTPATVAWYVDGTQKGTAAGSGSTWTFAWPLGNVSAGSTPNGDEVPLAEVAASVHAVDVSAEAVAAAEWPFPREGLADAVRRGYAQLPRAQKQLPLI